MKTLELFGSQSETTQTSREIAINGVSFFTENNKLGYFSKSDFLNYAEGLLLSERMQFAGFIDELRKGTKMDYNLSIRTDRKGISYIYPKFFYSRAVKGYKIFMTDGILRLIDDYAEGKIKIEVSAQGLATEAMIG